MAVYSIWESYFSESVEQGEDVTRRIWQDMTVFDGYLGHELLRDVDDPGHLFVLSRWTSKEHADAVLARYRDHPNAIEANELADQPRRRVVAAPLTAG